MMGTCKRTLLLIVILLPFAFHLEEAALSERASEQKEGEQTARRRH